MFSVIILSTIEALMHKIFSSLSMYYDFFPLHLMIDNHIKDLRIKKKKFKIINRYNAFFFLTEVNDIKALHYYGLKKSFSTPFQK